MTVQELIAKLENIEDKEREVKVCSAGNNLGIISVYEYTYEHAVGFLLEPIDISYYE